MISEHLNTDLMKAIWRMRAANRFLQRRLSGGDLEKLRLAVAVVKSSERWLEEAGIGAAKTNRNRRIIAEGVGARIGARKLCEEATKILRQSFGVIPGGRRGN
jgi:hypothetical protein